MDPEVTGEIRALRALHWFSNVGRNSFRLSNLVQTSASVLLTNAAHTVDRMNGETRESLPEFEEDLAMFGVKENYTNFLIAEQIWLESKPTEIQQYASALLQKLDRENFGQSQTSKGIQEVFYQIISSLDFGSRESISVLDPTCGYGVVLAGLPSLLPDMNLRLSGQEIDSYTYSTAQKLFKISNVNADIRFANLLQVDAFEGETFDLVLLDAPVGMKWDKSQVGGSDSRFEFGLPSSDDASLLFLQAAISKLKSADEGGGYVVAVTTNRNLVGDRSKAEILSGILQKDLMQAVIALPKGIAGYTQLPLYVVVLSNKKALNWAGKTQLVDVVAEFEEVPGRGERRLLVSSNGLSQISQAISKPKPTRAARTLTSDALWLQKCDVSYPDAVMRLWAKDDRVRIPNFTIQSKLVGVHEASFLKSELPLGIGGVQIDFRESYVSFQVEPRFASIGLEVEALDHSFSEYVSLMRLANNVLSFSKSKPPSQDEFRTEFLAVPRNSNSDCVHVHESEILSNFSNYIYVGFHDDAFIESACIWLNTSQGRSAREAAWRQVNSREKFIANLLTGKEVIEFLSLIRVPYLDSNRSSKILLAESMIAQSINTLRNLREEIWNDEEAISSVHQLTSAIRDQESFGTWAEHLPFPLAASLRTFESFNLDDVKAANQLIHFWEATSMFHATFLLSALKKSKDLWNSDIPRLSEALLKGHCNLDRATMGTWRITIEFLSAKFLTMLNSEDADEQNRAINLLGGASRHTLEKLLNPRISQLLAQVITFRNSYDGHSATMSSEHERVKKDTLVAFTNELKTELGHAWDGLQLVRPGAHFPLETGINVECEILMGPITPFVSDKIWVNENLRVGSLYLLSKSGAIQLAPFIQMNNAPAEVRNTCYFYNRTENDGIRMVSYHLAAQNELRDSSNQLQEMLQEMKSLTISPLESL